MAKRAGQKGAGQILRTPSELEEVVELHSTWRWNYINEGVLSFELEMSAMLL